MADEVYDVIVVGAGVEGSATAYQLSKRGVRVLLLEQFPLPHTRGSSHGQTRVTRKAYPERFYTDMMHYSTQQWEEIQRTMGETIIKKIGFLAIGPMNGEFLNENVSSMEGNGADYTLLDPDNFKKKYPYLKYGDHWGGVLDPEGGILMADKAVNAFQTLFVQNGGILIDGETVVRVEPGNIVTVKTLKKKFKTKSLVLCCGPWTNKLLRNLRMTLPLQPVRISVCYWPEKVPGTYSPGKFPTIFELNTAVGHEIYGLPSEEYPGHVKLCLHHGPSIDPDRRDSVDSQWTVDLVRTYVKEHFPGLKSRPSVVESCIYTNTPDKHFILDRHPVYKNVIIGAGFSGHGFKFAPTIGKILADLSMDINTHYDISHFKIDRFPDFNHFHANL